MIVQLGHPTSRATTHSLRSAGELLRERHRCAAALVNPLWPVSDLANVTADAVPIPCQNKSPASPQRFLFSHGRKSRKTLDGIRRQAS